MCEENLIEKSVASKSVYEGFILHVKEDDIELPNGKPAKRELIRHIGAVCVVPVTDNNEIIVERQFRYPINQVITEIPAGKLDSMDEDRLEAAKRELKEETGYEADACDKIKKETGKTVKPIYGCEIYFTDDEELKKDHNSKLYHMILLAKTNTGYHNLIKLVSKSHVDNFYRKPRTTLSMLKQYGEGLIGTSACIAGIIPKLLDQGQAEQALE